MTAAYTPPSYVRRFADVLRGVTLNRIAFSEPELQGHPGILTTSKIQYNERRWNFLQRDHEYTVYVGEKRLELSMQLYLNVTKHWRLFCYSGAGMLLSLNLTRLRSAGQSFTLRQHLHITT